MDLSSHEAFAQAAEHHRQGRLGDAERLYRHVLANTPGHADALHMLGLLGFQAGHAEEGARLITRAIAINSRDPRYFGNLGMIRKSQGRMEEAVQAIRQAVALQADLPEAHFNLGVVLEEAARPQEAAAAYERALVLRPAFAEALNNLGHVLEKLRSLDSAILKYRAAIAARPRFPEALGNLGRVLYSTGLLDESGSRFRQAISLSPNQSDLYFGLGNVLREQGQVDAAIELYRHSISIEPGSPHARFHLALALLLKGDFVHGWGMYEARWDLPENQRRIFSRPRWNGEPIAAGTRILVHAEQGFGDAIQVSRYFPLLRERGARVILECPDVLLSLFRQLKSVDCLFTWGDAVPDFDLHCAMMSLPGVFATRLDTIPPLAPCFSADMGKASYWRQKVGTLPATLKVGIAWAGRPNPPDRSLVPGALSSLSQVAGVSLISLQKKNKDTPAPSIALHDWTDELHDFSDTAALIANVDLVLSIDTAVAHLAGAMGKPTWVLLSAGCDWRWLLSRTDSPWYPTMRLFRQNVPRRWDEPMQEVATELAILAATYPPSGERP